MSTLVEKEDRKCSVSQVNELLVEVIKYQRNSNCTSQDKKLGCVIVNYRHALNVLESGKLEDDLVRTRFSV